MMPEKLNPRDSDLKRFVQVFSGDNESAINPDSPYYVPILEQKPEADPILALKTRIEFAVSESTNLLTGFRGNGKSTELRRLKKLLEDQGCRVFLINMLDFMLVTKPVKISDFILSLMAGLSDSVKMETGLNPIRKTYGERIKTFLKSEIMGDELVLKAGGEAASAELSLHLKTDSTFKDLIQKSLAGRITELVKDARDFASGLVEQLRKIENKPDLKVVLLVDSVEQLRGWGAEAVNVQNSVNEMFSGEADNLIFPLLHVVYTVPPYITAIAQNISRAFGGNPITSWPNIHVRAKSGDPDGDGLNIMKAIVERRYSEWRKYIPENLLFDLATASGGDLRDYFRLIRESLISLRNTSDRTIIDGEIISRVKNQLKREMIPIASDDAEWLLRVAKRKDTALETVGELPRLARFLDSNLIMNYLNGDPWYDVHPLILNELRRITSSHEA